MEMDITVGNSPVAQCWDPYAFTAEGLGATSSRGPKIPQAWRHSPKKMYLLRVNLNLHGSSASTGVNGVYRAVLEKALGNRHTQQRPRSKPECSGLY